MEQHKRKDVVIEKTQILLLRKLKDNFLSHVKYYQTKTKNNRPTSSLHQTPLWSKLLQSGYQAKTINAGIIKACIAFPLIKKINIRNYLGHAIHFHQPKIMTNGKALQK